MKRDGLKGDGMKRDGMKILVCVKQIPELEQVTFDRANRIVRDEVATLCNPLDTRALGHSLAIRSTSDEVVVMTMGPPGARDVLERAIEHGADRALHLTDKRFKGADTLATARALAEVVERESPELVLFGRITLDGGTAQLGQQVAELAGLSHVSEVTSVVRAGSELVVGRETELGEQTWQLAVPAALTVARGPCAPERHGGRVGEVTELSADDLSGQPSAYGTRGSPTFVKEVRHRDPERRGELVSDPELAVDRVAALLGSARDRREAWSAPAEPERDVWVLVEESGDGVDPVTFEGLAGARGIAKELNGRVTAVLFGRKERAVPDELGARGADRVLHVRGSRLGEHATAARTHAFAEAVRAEKPFAVVAPWTSAGRDYVPRAAARLGLGLTGDVTGVEVEHGENPRLVWVKPAWAGTAEALVISRTTPTLATLRPGSYQPLVPRDGSRAVVEAMDVEFPDGSAESVDGTSEVPHDDGQPRLVSSHQVVTDCSLDRSDVVFCLGSGISAETARQLRDMAADRGLGVGGSPEAVNAGHVPAQWELGVCKRAIAPSVCVAFGARDHSELAAMRGASELVVVNAQVRASAQAEADLRLAVEPEELVRGLLTRFAST